MAKTKIDPRSATKKAKDAVYAALPPARIVHPLRFINSETGSVQRDPKGHQYWVVSDTFEHALKLAKRGLGQLVQRLARGIALNPAL